MMRPLAVGEEPLPMMTDGEGPPSSSVEGQKDRNVRDPAKEKAKGRFHEINTFVDFSMKSLEGAELAVWLVLWRDTKDGAARTSQSDIARRAGITDRSVRRAIASLVKKGLLIVLTRGGLNRGLSVYRVRPLGKD